MRTSIILSVVSTLAVGFVASGCRVEAAVHTQTKFVETGISKEATKDYAGENIVIVNQNGGVVVRGDASATKVSVTAKPFAFADDDKKSDADQAIASVKESIVIDEGSAGTITIKCTVAAHSFGTAANGTSGCEDFTVRVPVPTDGISLSATAQNGQLEGTDLTATSSGSIKLRSENGSVTANNVTGSSDVSSDNGDVTANLTPTAGSTLSVTTGNGDIELGLPADFAAKSISFTAGKGVTVTGFSDVTDKSTSRNADAATAAESIKASASSLGTLTVKSR